jgi:hypothetical protein
MFLVHFEDMQRKILLYVFYCVGAFFFLKAKLYLLRNCIENFNDGPKTYTQD